MRIWRSGRDSNASTPCKLLIVGGSGLSPKFTKPHKTALPNTRLHPRSVSVAHSRNPMTARPARGRGADFSGWWSLRRMRAALAHTLIRRIRGWLVGALYESLLRVYFRHLFLGAAARSGNAATQNDSERYF